MCLYPLTLFSLFFSDFSHFLSLALDNFVLSRIPTLKTLPALPLSFSFGIFMDSYGISPISFLFHCRSCGSRISVPAFITISIVRLSCYLCSASARQVSFMLLSAFYSTIFHLRSPLSFSIAWLPSWFSDSYSRLRLRPIPSYLVITLPLWLEGFAQLL